MPPIVIQATKNSPIQKKLEITLGDYTILAGENNSGKTSIVEAIKSHADIIKEYGERIIYIPSDSIHPDKTELKRTATKDAFYKILDGILKPIFDTGMFKKLNDDFEKSTEKKTFINGVNEILKNDFGIDKKSFGIKLITDDLTRDIIIKEAVKTYAVDHYNTDIKEVDLENIGMGTQRMIISALIQSYSKIKNKEKTFLIIEEPEVYLHPKWKKNLHKSLLKLSVDPNIKVLVTTHDPYFIEMGINQTIYKVFRSPEIKDKDATAVKLIDNNIGKLGYKSDGEINYSIFETPTKSYFLELYEHVKDNSNLSSEALEKFLLSKINNKNLYDHDNPSITWKLTYISRLRHNLGHPKDTSSRKVKIDLSDKLEEAIKDLIKIA